MVAAGVLSLPLTFVRLVRRSSPGLLAGGLPVAGWPMGCGDRVWAGQAAVAGGPVAASNRFHPLLLAVPAFGQVQGDFAPAVAGGAGSDVDEVSAQRCPSGLSAGEAGLGTGSAQQVAGDGGAGEPGGVGGERTRLASGQNQQ